METCREDELNISEIRFCMICQIEQPNRTKHCRDCNRCVACHDHHCPWVGVCIGENNRRYFYFYLVSQGVLLWWGDIWVTIIQVIASFQIDNANLVAIGVNTSRGLLCIILVFFTLMVTLLIGFHTYLAAKNITTWELLSWYKISYLKDFDRANGSPFSQGIFKNLS